MANFPQCRSFSSWPQEKATAAYKRGVVRKMPKTLGHSLTHNAGDSGFFGSGAPAALLGHGAALSPSCRVSLICTTCNQLSQYFSSRTESPRANARPWAVSTTPTIVWPSFRARRPAVSTPASGACPVMPCQSITMAATYNESKHPINSTLGFIDLLPLRECETGNALPQFPHRNHVAMSRVTKQPLASQHDLGSPCPPADALGGRRPLTIPSDGDRASAPTRRDAAPPPDCTHDPW